MLDLMNIITSAGMIIQGMDNHLERCVRIWRKFYQVNKFVAYLICFLWKLKALFRREKLFWSQSLVLSQPSEQNTYADIEAAYKCLEESYGAKQEDIILYGQSVGSGPTVDLAARLPQLRAVVLHSPILSGVRVMYPVKRTYWFDIYKVAILLV